MKLKYIFIAVLSFIVVLTAFVYINSYLQRPKAGEIVTCRTYVPTDYNQDGVINGTDYVIWLNQNPTIPVCVSPTPSPIIINTLEDAFVNSENPNNNSGTDANLKVKASPEKISYLKFDLAPIAGKIISSAKLRIWISDPSNGFMEIHSVQDNFWTDKSEETDYIWTEKDLTYNSRPYPNLGNLIQSFTAPTSGTYKEIDLTGIVQKNRGKLMSLEFQTSSLNELEFKSRNVADQTKKPILIIDASPSKVNLPPVIISSWLEDIRYSTPGSRYPYTATLDQDHLGPMIYGYDLTDDVTAAIEMIQPDGSIVNTQADIDLPLGEITQTEEPAEFCRQVRCFYIHSGFWPQQVGLHKVTIRVADSKGAQAPPIVYEIMVVSDPPTTPSPSPTPIRCTSNSQCLNYQTCDLATRKCKNLLCPVPKQCKYYKYDNHSCVMENTYDGTSCLTSGLRGLCQSGTCAIIPTITPTRSPTPTYSKITPTPIEGKISAYFSPQTASIPPTTNMKIMLNSGGNSIAFAKVSFSFDPSLFKLTSEINTNPNMSIIVEKTTMTTANSLGKAVIAIGASPSDTAPNGIFELASFNIDSNTTLLNLSTRIVFNSIENQIVNSLGIQLPVNYTNPTVLINGASATWTPTPGFFNNLTPTPGI